MNCISVTIKSEYFNAILNGTKKKEYRDVSNYWISRLTNKDYSFKKIKTIEFINGYSPTARRATFEVKSISVTKDEDMFVITIGKEISRKYC